MKRRIALVALSIVTAASCAREESSSTVHGSSGAGPTKKAADGATLYDTGMGEDVLVDFDALGTGDVIGDELPDPVCATTTDPVTTTTTTAYPVGPTTSTTTTTVTTSYTTIATSDGMALADAPATICPPGTKLTGSWESTNKYRYRYRKGGTEHSFEYNIVIELRSKEVGGKTVVTGMITLEEGIYYFGKAPLKAKTKVTSPVESTESVPDLEADAAKAGAHETAVGRLFEKTSLIIKKGATAPELYITMPGATTATKIPLEKKLVRVRDLGSELK